ncbi:MAG TPA: YcnI family protein [Alphaproteobacteria bacterium]|nr:YcnI family protein [Alphaproteobacteria bacterium]
MTRVVAMAATLASTALIGTASAHVTLDQRTATAGSTYKAVLRVPHGCDGKAMIRLRVRIPDGVINVKPMPKPGWNVATVKEKLVAPITLEHGRQLTETIREVSWSGGNLPDDFYDEFVFRAELPKKPGTTLYFPVVQECDGAVSRWIEIPESGKSSRDYAEPAPALRLVAPDQR